MKSQCEIHNQTKSQSVNVKSVTITLIKLYQSYYNNTQPSFLDGDFIFRARRIQKCCLEVMRRGFTLFGIREGGMCVSAFGAEYKYKQMGIATTCVDGMGAASDSSVYKRIMPGKLKF
jgi:hypothetical protein